MRAAVLRGGAVEARVIDDPVPGPGQLLVRSLACGICASDLHFMDHPEAGADDESGMSTYDTDVDIVMGHEYCAEVVGYGPGTERRIPVGTRVSSLPVLATAGGRKIIGQNPESPGGFGEYLLLTEAITRVVASDLPSEIVCIADAISVGWSTATRAAVTAREGPLLIGCGAIGLSVIATLKLLGVSPIVAVDFVASRRETALAMGADVVIDPAGISPYQAWREVASGPAEPMKDMMAAASLPGCVVFECVGIPGVLDSIIKGCERGTRIFSVGGPPEGDRLHTLTAKRKGLNIQFGGGPSMAHWDEAFEAVCSGRLDVRPMLGRTAGLEADGLTCASTVAEAVRDADAVFVVVLTDEQVRSVCLAPDGAIATMKPGATLIQHTTSDPATAQLLAGAGADREIGVLDAALSGGPHDIAAGRLTLWVGGDQALLAEMRPLLQTYASPIMFVGPAGNGQRVKLVNNALFVAQVGLAIDAVRLAGSLGIEEKAILAAVQHGSGASRALAIVAGGGSVDAVAGRLGSLMLKDVTVVREVAQSAGADLGIIGTVLSSDAVEKKVLHPASAPDRAS